MAERTKIGAADRGRLHTSLLAWYRVHRRDLPWRRTRDPYAIWVSEAMLQQTRVETVLAYYGRFLARFPTLVELAVAPEGDVLALWSGLGYYRRARSLQAAARAIVERHGGVFPRDPAAVRALPGIGPYTAGAVLSIAFDAREPLVDGNVARVLARWTALDGEPATIARELWELAAALLPERGAGDWNQALMELGATVCTPRLPRCDACPVTALCRARRLGLEAELPRPRPRPVTLAVEALVVLVERRGRWLVVRRGADEGRMAGMLEFPTVELAGADGGRTGLFPAALEDGGRPLLETGAEVGELRHTITRHRIRARVALGRALFTGRRAEFVWASAAELGRLELTGMAKKVLARGLLAMPPR